MAVFHLYEFFCFLKQSEVLGFVSQIYCKYFAVIGYISRQLRASHKRSMYLTKKVVTEAESSPCRQPIKTSFSDCVPHIMT